MQSPINSPADAAILIVSILAQLFIELKAPIATLLQNPFGRKDLLSQLPDALLLSILLLLPAKDSIRTSVLSSRWRDLWKQNPLILNIESNNRNRYWVNEAAAHIAVRHPGPIHSLRISEFYFPFEVDMLIEIIASKGIKELDLSFGHRQYSRYQLPLSLARCQSLRNMYLSGCSFPGPPVPDWNFPNLRELTLNFVLLCDDLLHCLLKSCSRLEVLELINCGGFRHLCLNCANLQKFTIHDCSVGDGKRLVVEYAPELRSLRLGERTITNTRIVVQHAPKLEALGFFSMDATMRIGNTFIKTDNQFEMFVNKNLVLPTVKKLAILVDFANGTKCSLLSQVLSCFPCLETLYIKSITSTGHLPDEGLWEQQFPFSFLKCHLKSFIMVNVDRGSTPEVEFVKFLVRHGRVLERVTMVCQNKLSVTGKDTMLGELDLKNCASKKLEVVFLSKAEYESDSCEWAPLIYRPLRA